MDFLELTNILLEDKPSRTLIERKNDLAKLIPEFSDSYDFNQHTIWHPYDVFTHTLKVVDGVDCDLNLRIAALFHDIGKPYTMRIGDDGNGHFYGHWEKSKEIFSKYKDRFNPEYVDTLLVKDLIEYHDLSINMKSIHKFMRTFTPDNMELLFMLKEADIKAQNKDFIEERLDDLEKQKKLYYMSLTDSYEYIKRKEDE